MPLSVLSGWRHFALVVVALFCLAGRAGAQGWQWAHQASDAGQPHSTATAAAQSGSVYVTGNFTGAVNFGSTTLTAAGGQDVYLVKYDAAGNVLWAIQAGGIADDGGLSVSTDVAGNVYLCGFYKSTAPVFDTVSLALSGSQDGFAACYDSLGHLQWVRTIRASTGNCEATAVQADPAGHIYVAGNFSSPNLYTGADTLANTSTDGSDNMFVIQYSVSGAATWARAGSGNHMDAAGLTTDATGAVYVSGYYNSATAIFSPVSIASAGGYDLYIAKYTASGGVAWARGAGGIGDEEATCLTTDASGRIFLGGWFSSPAISIGSELTNHGIVDGFLARMDSSGTFDWGSDIGGGDSDLVLAISATPEMGVYVTGSFKSAVCSLGTSTIANSGIANILLAKYDTTGNLQFVNQTGGTGNDKPSGVAATPAASAYVAGNFSSPSIYFNYFSLTNSGSSQVFEARFGDTATVPGPITGVMSVCLGNTTTLFNTLPGGFWASSNTAIATVNPVTGTVHGLATGTDTITYTYGGYVVMVPFTVVTTPLAGSISGPTVVCMYSTITLSETVSGGRWSAGGVDASAAAGGLITGLNAGVDTVRYIDSNACGVAIAMHPITINASPTLAPISGSSSLCAGAVITLSDAVSGGAWSATNGHASVTGSGIITGASGGTDTIHYAKSNFLCTTVVGKVITVIPFPSAGVITGVSSLCVGVTDTFSDTVTGGAWGSLTPSKLAVSGTGVATGIAGGTGIVGYTVTNTCGTATATKSITVLPLANPGAITGPDSVCLGSAITIGDVITGGTWTVVNSDVSDSANIVSGLALGVDTIEYTVTNTCGPETALKIITVLTLPAVDSIVGPPGLCTHSTITLTDSTAGGIWTRSNTLVSDSLMGAAGILVRSGASTGRDTIVYTCTNLCGSVAMTHIVAVDPYPVAGTIVGLDTLCAGADSTYTDAAPGGVWSDTDPFVCFVSGSSVTALFAGTDTLIYTVANACATVATQMQITVLPLPNAGIIVGVDTVCIAGSATFLESMPGGVWSLTNANATDTGAIIYGVSVGLDTVFYTYTNACGTDQTSASFYVKPLPTIAPLTGPDSMCILGTLTLNDATPSGVWSASNSNAVVTDGLVTGLSAGADTIIYTYNNICGSIAAAHVVTVEPLPSPGLISGTDSLCLGDSTLLTESITGGMWTSEVAAIATVNSGWVKGLFIGPDSIYYTVTNACGSSTTAFFTRVMTTLTPAITGNTLVCIGTSNDTLSGTPTGGSWSALNTNVSYSVLGGDLVLAGAAIGGDTVVYTTTNYCGTTFATAPVLVSERPHPVITGINTVCTGKTDTLAGTPGGGIWGTSGIYGSITGSPYGVVVHGDSAGTVYLYYTLSSVCGPASDTVSITVFSKAYCDSVNAVPAVFPMSNELKISPNPCAGIFELNVFIEAGSNLSIYDLSGRKMSYKVLPDSPSSSRIELPDAPVGVYFLRLGTPRGIMTTKLIVER